jgi:uncharacterized protein DUF5658
VKTHYTCSRCGQPFAANRDLSGLRVKCLRCGQVQQLLEADSLPGSAPSAYELFAPPVASPLPAILPVEPATALVTHSPKEKPSRSVWQEWVRPWVLETSRVQGLGTCLAILSAADLLMTFALLRRSPAFIESNPVARWFFVQWDMAGMVFFKFSIIGGVILLSEIIERKRPGWGRFVLLVGCAGAAYAIFHGVRLYVAHGDLPMAAELD